MTAEELAGAIKQALWLSSQDIDTELEADTGRMDPKVHVWIGQQTFTVTVTEDT